MQGPEGVFTENDRTTVLVNLPGNWNKKFVQRINGASKGQWDVYLNAPCQRRIRSNVKLVEYVKETGIAIDPSIINLDRTLPQDCLS